MKIICLWRCIAFCGTVFACDDCKWGEGIGFALNFCLNLLLKCLVASE